MGIALQGERDGASQGTSQQALTAAAEGLGLVFNCAGVKGDFGKGRDDKHCDSGAAALGTHVVAPTLGSNPQQSYGDSSASMSP